jgi:hypothetical protein
MGKWAVVTLEDSVITLSMVKWGALRRAVLVLGRKSGVISRFSPTLFIPSYECAVYDGGPRQLLRKLPRVTFYFANQNTAQTEFEELRGALQKDGVHASEHREPKHRLGGPRGLLSRAPTLDDEVSSFRTGARNRHLPLMS